MLRIGICDDDANARGHLRTRLQVLLREQEAVAFLEFSSGEGVVSWAQKHVGELDLLFLDVEMRGISGIEAATQIREFDCQLILVFATGYTDFVFDGYAVQALDYLVKPIQEERLQAVILRAQAQLSRQTPDMYIVKNADGLYRISKSSILYFYSNKRQVILVTKQGEYPFYDKLDQVEQNIGAGFVRIHQRYLIRANAVRTLTASAVWVGDTELPISRALRTAATFALTHALLQNTVL